MGRVLIVYNRSPLVAWRPTYDSHLNSFRRFSKHRCFYLNTARASVPKYLLSLDPDLVILHYTFLARRNSGLPDEFSSQIDLIGFIRDLRCPKAMIPHDEQSRSDRLCDVAQELGVTHIFTPAPPSEWTRIYEGLDLRSVAIHNVLTGYVDGPTARRIARRMRRHNCRTVDVGYRSWDTWPAYGRHGQLKGEIGRLFAERAPGLGLVTDISCERKDALLGDSWFDFLLNCRYTIGVEGGSSVFDRDGRVAQRTREYLASHSEASFEEVEAACFPGMDGQFDYRLLGPRHLEAVMTKTCQVLVAGHYGGVLRPHEHYIELNRDFSNADEVLELLKRGDLRTVIVERAYQELVASGTWSYRAFADTVLEKSLGALAPAPRNALRRLSISTAYNRIDERLTQWSLVTKYRLPYVRNAVRATLRPWASTLLGEELLQRFLTRVRSGGPRPK